MAFLVGSTAPGLRRLAVPFATLLILVLGYGSQWLFATTSDLTPGPLTTTESRVFNSLLVCLWWTYWRACTVDPGRYEFPRPAKGDGRKARKKRENEDGEHSSSPSEAEYDDEEEKKSAGDNSSRGIKAHVLAAARRSRWCRKCAAPKPPRAHHCKTCGRCVPRMDHHCPWTGNCVSLQTFPHFLRFLFYTNLSLWCLLHFLRDRLSALWAARDLPAYLGPSAPRLAILAVISFATGLTTLALGILLATTMHGWVFNTTMIEGWEIDRHEAVMRRRRGYGGGDDEDDDDDWWRTEDGDSEAAPRAMVDPVEFPYDVGVFTNMAQAMGTSNLLLWILPFVPGPRVARPPSGVKLGDIAAALNSGGGGGGGGIKSARSLGTGWWYEENGLNDREGMWPPVDPDKVRDARMWRRRRREELRYRREQAVGLRDPQPPLDAGLTPAQEKEAFRIRQERDLRRWRGGGDTRGEIIDELEEFRPRQNVVVSEGRSGWVNSDGDHLGDYGVDEDAEFEDAEFDDYVYDDEEEEEEDKGLRGDVASRHDTTMRTYALDQDDEDVPLAELIRRRKVRTKDGEDT